ncbi:hypothetical protein PGTUg99_020543 [Puccinia graminis f. sp. tritici]|uniref:Uncharacterized protein n=1 Tax=Puccinia graminis f. sp. tritici TaxID=56615 RepID=A0A5B0QKE7_PUCGR|nr:hypothetical protein PGTUg99_020543 [Puccinia graminis f. sp. tritici]
MRGSEGGLRRLQQIGSVCTGQRRIRPFSNSRQGKGKADVEEHEGRQSAGQLILVPEAFRRGSQGYLPETTTYYEAGFSEPANEEKFSRCHSKKTHSIDLGARTKARRNPKVKRPAACA